MANRHLARSVAMQTLFEWDFNGRDNSKVGDMFDYTMREFAPGIEDVSFAKKIVSGVVEHQEKIDQIITKAAPEWPLAQIAVVDRNVLRIGLYELIFSSKREVPSKVAINESIELAKSFGGESSGKFVNGVLGTVFRELGGQDEPEEMPIEVLAGAIVYRKEGEDYYFAFVHDVFGYWTLSKGRLEGAENVAEGATREVKEEIGINITPEEEVGKNEYIASDPEKGKIRKQVAYVLASTQDTELKLKETGGLDNAKWFKMEELGDLRIYDDIKPIIAKAVKIVCSANLKKE